MYPLMDAIDRTDTEKMIQVLYISSASKPLSTEDLIALLQQSLTSNTDTGVTGMLLYGNGTFLQALEGEERVVDALCDRIREDPRHTNVTFLYRRRIERRQYPDWSMGFKRVSDKDLQHVIGLRDFGAKDFNSEYLAKNAKVADTVMEHFRKPYWDPLVRELDEREDVIKQLKKTLAQTRSGAEIASLILESVVHASKTGGLTEGHVRLCELALDALAKATAAEA